MAEALQGQVFTNKVESDAEPALIVERRSAIKLADAPKIAVCMPCGDKDDPNYFTCGKCGEAHQQVSSRRTKGLVPLHWATNHMQIVSPLNCSLSYYFEFGRLAAEAREVLTHRALQDNPQYIFYWDDDVLIPPLALYNMHQFLETHPDIGAVCGVYTTREENCEPVIYKEHGQGAYWGFAAGAGGEPEEIFSTGAGCLLVKASVIKKMETPYWADAQEYNGYDQRVTWGHDVRFCVKIKTEANSKLYMMPDTLCAHWDAAKQQAFMLPPESPPMKRWRMMNWRQYWSETWQGFGVKNAPRYPEAYYKIVQEIPQGARVLDLGCGSGVLMQQAHMQRGAVVHGYDSSGEAVTYCKALFLNTDELDLRNLKDEHVEACDVVTLAFVLEHLDDAVRDRVLETCKGKKVIASIDAKADYNNGLTPKKLKKLFQKHFSNVQCVRHKQYVVCTGVNDGEPGI